MLSDADRLKLKDIEARLAEEEAAWERIREIDKELEWEDSISAAEKLQREYAGLCERANELHIRNSGGCDDDVEFLLALVRRLTLSVDK